MRNRKSTIVATLLVAMIAADFAAGDAGSRSEGLAALLEQQPEMFKARYQYRHPQQTLAFFEVEAGMTVVEALPGGGWYSKIFVPYLGMDGHLIGADYAQEMWPLFGFFSDKYVEDKKTWVTDWPAEAKEWGGTGGAKVSAFKFGTMPASLHGTVDRVLFVRALHNLNRFDGQGGFLKDALRNAYDALKPGGLLCVVQHQARENKPDEWARGQRGYLKKAYVIESLEQAGFEFLGDIAINENKYDRPGDNDVVWRLPPSFNGVGDNAERKKELEEIGESNRMTLKFRKPE